MRVMSALNTTCAVRVAVLLALEDAGIALPDPGVRSVAPRDIDRWQSALFPDDSQPAGWSRPGRRETSRNWPARTSIDNYQIPSIW